MVRSAAHQSREIHGQVEGHSPDTELGRLLAGLVQRDGSLHPHTAPKRRASATAPTLSQMLTTMMSSPDRGTAVQLLQYRRLRQDGQPGPGRPDDCCGDEGEDQFSTMHHYRTPRA